MRLAGRPENGAFACFLYLHLGGQRTMRKSAEKDFKASRVLTASEECLEVSG